MKRCWLAALLALLLPHTSSAQPGAIVTVEPRQAVVKRGGEGVVELHLAILRGYHINSNKPLDEYLIPLALTWDKGPLEVKGIDYPQPELAKYEFSDKPLSVYTGAVTIKTMVRAGANATAGATTWTGKLRYQGCSDKACYPPKTLTISVPVDVR